MLRRGDAGIDRHLLGLCRWHALVFGHDDRAGGRLIALDGPCAKPPQRGAIADALLLGVLAEFHTERRARLYVFVTRWYRFLGPITTHESVYRKMARTPLNASRG